MTAVPATWCTRAVPLPREAAAGRADDPVVVSLGALDEILGYHVARTAMSTMAGFDQHVGAPFGLRKVEYSILLLLLANGPLSAKQLGATLALSAPNLSLLLDRLQQRQLLKRERSTTDRRSRNIVLSDSGLRVARDSAAAAGPMEAALLGRLTPAERLMLLELLRKVAGS